MRKIVSFSLFGTDKKYYVGVEKNYNIMKEIMQDWEMDVYYHPDYINTDEFNKVKDVGCNFINVSEIALDINKKLQDYPIPFFWRFFSFFNNEINIARDLDSRLGERELIYINRWIDSGKTFFVIRDHPWHSPYPAGLIGIRGNKHNFKEYCENFINSKNLVWGDDQTILMGFMEDKDLTDLEYCGFDKENTYIKRDDENFFIGIQLDENDQPLHNSVLGLECLKNYGL